MSVTMRDVAKQAGVSLKTVSRVINNEDNVTPETREWILKVARDLDFVPNLAARNLSRGKAMAIGVVLGWTIDSTYSSSLMFFIQTECANNGYNTVLISMGKNVSDQVVQACLGKQVDGVILDTIASVDTRLRAQLDSLQIPYLIIHPHSMDGMVGISYVTIDDHNGAKTAIKYLIDHGHTSIGCLLGNSERIQDKNRLNGYREALKDAGLPYRDALVYLDNPSDFSLGYTGALNLMSNNNDLTAIFCHTDEVAMGAMSAIWQSGRVIPDDISVIGFDDIRYAAMMIPPLTTIHQPIDQIAKVAVIQLIKMINDPDTEQLNEKLPISLIVRETTKQYNK